VSGWDSPSDRRWASKAFKAVAKSGVGRSMVLLRGRAAGRWVRPASSPLAATPSGTEARPAAGETITAKDAETSKAGYPTATARVAGPDAAIKPRRAPGASDRPAHSVTTTLPATPPAASAA
jgi:hypothetical protein